VTRSEWAPVRRLDPARVLDRLAEHTGVRLRLAGMSSHGEVGAAYVTWPDGHRSVLTHGPGHVAPLLDIARAAGIPAPRYELAVDLGDDAVVVQELLPGVPPSTVDRALVDRMLGLHDRFAGLLADHPELPLVELYLRRSGPGFCLHEPLAGYDRRTARLLDRIRAVGAERDTADGDDLLHMDFHRGNVLVDPAGRITGLVDWDGAGRGDAALDLVTLRVDLATQAPEVGRWLDGVLAERVPAGRLRAYRAHQSLRMVDWSIRHFGPAEVAFYLDLTEPWLSG
jgi:hypothetical protein